MFPFFAACFRSFDHRDIKLLRNKNTRIWDCSRNNRRKIRWSNQSPTAGALGTDSCYGSCKFLKCRYSGYSAFQRKKIKSGWLSQSRRIRPSAVRLGFFFRTPQPLAYSTPVRAYRGYAYFRFKLGCVATIVCDVSSCQDKDALSKFHVASIRD
jgi:hypothetical protein